MKNKLKALLCVVSITLTVAVSIYVNQVRQDVETYTEPSIVVAEVWRQSPN